MKARYALIALPIALVLVGIGCAEKADEVAEDAVKPIAAPIAALNQANQATAGINASSRRKADLIENLLPVAMVLPDGQTAPASGVERLQTATFGCLDRIGYVRVSREAATNDVLKDALMTLFSVRDATVNAMYNSLWQSTLMVDQVQGVGADTVEVYISGEALTSGVCDDPRFKEQIEATVRQYWPNYTIFLNGTEKEWECFGDQSGLCG
ncbi:MAG: hypothetical protein U9Q03_03930 [Patescibacteria group bacterium]|nr:hypothetical protein [Patescibacteria group bacterium]